MAGEWTKFEDDLPEKAETLVIARQINKDPKWVACTLMAVWAWARRNSLDGVVRGGTFADVDAKAGRRGFGDAMAHRDVMWLTTTPDGIAFPKWERHNSNGAKRRAEDAEKKRKQRDKCPENVPEEEGQNRDNVPKITGPEKRERREEKIQTPPPPSAGTRFAIAVAEDAERPITDFHLTTLDAVESIFGGPLAASDLRRVAEWTLEIEAAKPYAGMNGGTIPLASVVPEAIAEAVKTNATGSVAGLIGYARKVLARCSREGVRPGESRKLGSAKLTTVEPKRDYDAMLDRAEELQRKARR